jgi:hypothetical protein
MQVSFEDTKRAMTRDSIADFPTYEEYLDSQISEKERYYLEDEDLARQLVERGYRGNGESVKREDFEAKKAEIAESKKLETSRKVKSLCSAIPGRDYSDTPFLAALANREENVRNGKLTSIIFIRHMHPRTNQEISGYIDYAHRLKQEDFGPYFRGDKKLYPRQSDLSYYNWATQTYAP